MRTQRDRNKRTYIVANVSNGGKERRIIFERERRKFESVIVKNWQCLVRNNSIVSEQLTSPQPPEPTMPDLMPMY
jgi:hypothetical protein